MKGFTIDEIAKVMEVSPVTVKRDWRNACSALKGRLNTDAS
jgi:DNA-directed RNA polymerase specialized sigma24 family protein